MSFVLPSTLEAQAILGRIIDARSKLPVRGVSIVMFPDTGSAAHPVAQGSADTLGLFYIDAPAPGRYRLAFNVGDRESFVGSPIVVAGEDVQREFVVDTSGRAVLSTFKPLRSTDDRFTESVRHWLRDADFSPAEVRHRKVAQVVRMPFRFGIGDHSDPDLRRLMGEEQPHCHSL